MLDDFEPESFEESLHYVMAGDMAYRDAGVLVKLSNLFDSKGNCYGAHPFALPPDIDHELIDENFIWMAVLMVRIVLKESDRAFI
ncbi:hypothetical protein BN1263200064 [Stenotrophomonas maltophilia]|nr:hypothetical protein BN1263200064 [Stenotrophomonas maltophilia]